MCIQVSKSFANFIESDMPRFLPDLIEIFKVDPAVLARFRAFILHLDVHGKGICIVS